MDVNMRQESAIEFDPGQVCCWLNGLARLSPSIIGFCQEKENQRKLLRKNQNRLLLTPGNLSPAVGDYIFDTYICG